MTAAVRSLRCSHQGCWRFERFGMLQCVVGWIVPEMELQFWGQAIFLDCWILNMKALQSFAMSVTTYPVTQRNIFIHSVDLDGRSMHSSWHFVCPHRKLNELTKFSFPVLNDVAVQVWRSWQAQWMEMSVTSGGQQAVRLATSVGTNTWKKTKVLTRNHGRELFNDSIETLQW